MSEVIPIAAIRAALVAEAEARLLRDILRGLEEIDSPNCTTIRLQAERQEQRARLLREGRTP